MNYKTCTFDGCGLPVRNSYGSLCNGHYQQKYRGEDLRPLRKTSRAEVKPCAFDGCVYPRMGRKDFCSGHQQQLTKGKSLVLAPLRNRNGGRWYVNNSGYLIRQWHENGEQRHVLQHREVMEQHLGRKLTKDESVHHKNGDRQDNRIENLELWSRYQPNGQRVSDKITYAKEILDRYGDNPDDYA